MNVNALLDLQIELLKPFAPTQEFALLSLIVKDVEQETVVDFCTEIQYRFPHVFSLYDKYANTRPVDAVPLIIPVSNTETVRDYVFASGESNITLTPQFVEVLEYYLKRVPLHVSTLDEIGSGAPEAYERLHIEEVSAGILRGFFAGNAPVVIHRKKKSDANIVVNMWRYIFPTAA